MTRYLKAIVAIVGAATTAALGIVPPHTQVWQILTAISAVATAAGVYVVPNIPTALKPAPAPLTACAMKSPPPAPAEPHPGSQMGQPAA